MLAWLQGGTNFVAGFEQQLTNAVAFLPGDSSPELASVQNECLKWEAVKSEPNVVHLLTLQLGPVRLCKLGRSSLPSVLSTQHSDQGICWRVS